MQLLCVMTTFCPSRPQISIVLLNLTARRLTLYDWILTGLIKQPSPFVAGAKVPCDFGNVQPLRLKFLYLFVAFFARRVPLLPFNLISLGTDVLTRRRRLCIVKSPSYAYRQLILIAQKPISP